MLPASRRTARSGCLWSLPIRRRSSSPSVPAISRRTRSGGSGHHLRRGRAAPHRRVPSQGLYVGSVVVTRHAAQPAADAFKRRMESLGMRVYLHYPIAGYPNNIPSSSATRDTAKRLYRDQPAPGGGHRPGPGSGKMAVPPQLYHAQAGRSRRATPSLRPSPSGICPPAPGEPGLPTRPPRRTWGDVNMIDPFHLAAHGADYGQL